MELFNVWSNLFKNSLERGKEQKGNKEEIRDKTQEEKKQDEVERKLRAKQEQQHC